MGKIFISYRRAQSEYVVGRIYDNLCHNYGEENVFKDIDSIPLGVDFREVISSAVQSCNVLLAIISDDWDEIKDQSGKRRLFDPNDFVRIEIESALDRDIPVIPIIVNNSTLPKEEDLPPSLKSLAYRNAISIRPDPDFESDINRLNKDLAKILGKNNNKIKYIVSAIIATLVVSISLFFLQQNKEIDTTKGNQQSELEESKLSIDFRGKITRKQITGLQQKFNKMGIKTSAPFRNGSIENNIVTYFKLKDEKISSSIVDITMQYFFELGCPVELHTKLEAKPNRLNREEDIQINIYHKCG